MNKKSLHIGDKIGSRTVVEEMTERKNGYILYRVMCECGDIMILNGSYLKSKSRPCKSCSAKLNTRKGKDHYAYKHGMSTRTKGKDRIYSIWVSMRQRCNDPNDQQYKDYGGRGIKVCAQWNDFMAFYDDMGERPSDMQLDRIDNNGNYCKENCRWADINTQANNRRNNRIHIIDGVKVKNCDLLKVLNMSRDKFKNIEIRKGIEWLYEIYKEMK